jgi:hypothetical protein
MHDISGHMRYMYNDVSRAGICTTSQGCYMHKISRVHASEERANMLASRKHTRRSFRGDTCAPIYMKRAVHGTRRHALYTTCARIALPFCGHEKDMLVMRAELTHVHLFCPHLVRSHAVTYLYTNTHKHNAGCGTNTHKHNAGCGMDTMQKVHIGRSAKQHLHKFSSLGGPKLLTRITLVTLDAPAQCALSLLNQTLIAKT